MKSIMNNTKTFILYTGLVYTPDNIQQSNCPLVACLQGDRDCFSEPDQMCQKKPQAGT